MEIQQFAKNLELNLRNHETSQELKQPLDSLIEEVQRFHRTLAGIQITPELHSQDKVSAEQLPKILGQLKAYLEADDTLVNKLFIKHESVLEGYFAHELDLLRLHIEGFDYGAALQSLQALPGFSSFQKLNEGMSQ